MLWPGGLISLGLIEGDDVTGVEFSELLLLLLLFGGNVVGVVLIVVVVATGGDRAASDRFCG